MHDDYIEWPLLGKAILITWAYIGLILIGVLSLPAEGHVLPVAGKPKAHTHDPELYKSDDYSIFVGFGTGSSTGSGNVTIGAMQTKHIEIFGSIWTDANKEDTRLVRQPPRLGSQQTAILLVEGDKDRSANLCVGGMYNWTPWRFRLAAGLAYCANDNTVNIDNHLQGVIKAMYEIDWKFIGECGGMHYSDSETFVGCGYKF